MPQLIATKVQKARKPHRRRCCWSVAIEPGETYTKDTYVYDSRVYDWICCGDCRDLTNTVWEWAYRPDEGVGEDTYLDWAREFENDPEHGESARAFLNRRSS